MSSPDAEPETERGEVTAEREALLEAAAAGVAPQPDQTVKVEAPPLEKPHSWPVRFLRYLVTANAVMVTVYSLILAMIIGGILIIVSDEEIRGMYTYFFSRPGDALSASWTAVADAYSALFQGAIINFEQLSLALNGESEWGPVLRPISNTLTNAAPLIFTGLAVALAFRAGLFNIGAQGQAIAGAVGAAVVGFGLDLPLGIHLVVTLAGGALAGGLWGAIPGILKARTGAHEVITSIMLNYVAAYGLLWVISTEFVHSEERTDAISKSVDNTSWLPNLFLDANLRANWGVLFAVAAAGVVGWLLTRSTLGFRMRTVGANPDAARTAGMGVPNTYATAMGLAGALAGLGGAVIMLSSTSHALTPAVVGNVGFDGITVALLGRAKPVGVVLSGLLFGAMQAGGVQMQTVADIPVDMVTVLQALIVIFIAAPALVKAIFRLRTSRGAGMDLTMAKGW
ncbi:ABC transporter permease [Phytomonospora endophytica]|uniref:ABC transporter permease n=1 Tax=Phytomonospora endophytica TaxID=714109 RepID=UPI003570BE69